jgi:hypothetical protein
MVASMVATNRCSPALTARTSPPHTVTVRPGLMTRPRASIRSPWAGDKKFTLYSTVKTEAPDGINVIAA